MSLIDDIRRDAMDRLQVKSEVVRRQGFNINVGESFDVVISVENTDSALCFNHVKVGISGTAYATPQFDPTVHPIEEEQLLPHERLVRTLTFTADKDRGGTGNEQYADVEVTADCDITGLLTGLRKEEQFYENILPKVEPPTRPIKPTIEPTAKA